MAPGARRGPSFAYHLSQRFRDDECEYVVSGKLRATLSLSIFPRVYGSPGLVKVVDRTYAVDLYAARSGLPPCTAFDPTPLEVKIRTVLATGDLDAGEKFVPTRKILDLNTGPHGCRFVWDSFTVLMFSPVVQLSFDPESNTAGMPPVALDLSVSEYNKQDGKAVMSQSGSYFHGVSIRMPLK